MRRKTASRVFCLVVCLSGSAAAYDSDDLAILLAAKACLGCDLRGADLSKQNLVRANLKWSDLSAADLRGADLSAADLTGAILENAKITDARLEGAKLEGARLVGTELHAAHLTGADLRWADMSHLDADFDLEFVDLVGVQLQGARFKHGVRCAGVPDKGGWGCKAR